jgi:S-formylglutathione hydrolase FrmB
MNGLHRGRVEARFLRLNCEFKRDGGDVDEEVDSSAQRSDKYHRSRGARRWLSRRSVLIAGASGLGVAGLAAGTATGPMSYSTAFQRALGFASSTPVTQLGTAKVERVYSAARGREIEILTMLPAKSAPAGLPMSLLLHGLGGNARDAAPTGLLKQLSSDVERGAVPAYGFFAVDGGDHYWHENQPGDNPMAMLLEEVPLWLHQRGLGGKDGQPFACTGTSMGGFGALLYTRRRVERRQPPAAVAVLAPALITSWAEMSKRHAFHDSADWASMDPLRHVDATRSVPTGVWCGTEDEFIGGVREFIAAAHPAYAYTAPGEHGDTFNRTVVEGVVGFLGKHVARTA